MYPEITIYIIILIKELCKLCEDEFNRVHRYIAEVEWSAVVEQSGRVQCSGICAIIFTLPEVKQTKYGPFKLSLLSKLVLP